MFNLTTWLVFVMAITLALVGMSHAAKDNESWRLGDYEPKGFLSTYSKLQPEGVESKAIFYRNPYIERSSYAKVMIDRIQMYIKEDAENMGVDPAELKELTDYFYPRSQPGCSP